MKNSSKEQQRQIQVNRFMLKKHEEALRNLVEPSNPAEIIRRSRGIASAGTWYELQKAHHEYKISEIETILKERYGVKP